MKSLKDPYGQQINYGFDKVGRLNNVSGSTAFAGITNYADTPTYNARGILTHLNYGNGVEMNITNFNNKLQATNFEVKKDTTSIIKKNYEFNADSSLKYSQDVVDAKFDRSYKYDFASRIMEAKTGAEARGGTVPTIDQEAQLPYRQSYNYNVYNQLTQRNNRHWGVEYWYQQNNNLSYTYQNNRITNSGYAYDADGRSLNSLEGNGSNSYYDSSGSMTRVVSWSESDIYRYNDGNGRESKRKTIRWITDEYGSEYWSTTPEFKYYIRSSLFGNEVVTQIDKTGRKEKTIIRAAGSELAVNGVYYYGTTNTQSEHLFFKHSDPSGASIRVTDPTGIESGGDGTENAPAELDAFGGNVGFYSPYIVLQTFPDPETQNWDYLYNESPMYVNGQVVKATLDGMSVPLSMALNRLQNGSAIPAALAGYQGRNGFSFEYLGAGLFQTNIPDAWRTYKDGKPNPIFYEPHGKGADGELVSTGGIYLTSWSARLALAGISRQTGIATKTDTVQSGSNAPLVNKKNLVKALNYCANYIFGLADRVSEFSEVNPGKNGRIKFSGKNNISVETGLDFTREALEYIAGAVGTVGLTFGVGQAATGDVQTIKYYLNSSNTFGSATVLVDPKRTNYVGNDLFGMESKSRTASTSSFGLALATQIHEIGHSLSAIVFGSNNDPDGNGTEIGQAFEDCVGEKYQTLSSKKKTRKK